MSGSAPTTGLLSLAAGRRLLWGPRWNCAEAGLAFDVNSGDFWVLTPLARQIIEQLLTQDRLSEAELRSRTAGDSRPADWAETLAAVVQSGLVQQAVDVADQRHPNLTT
ncbi:MAG: hypothetical protein Q8N44_22055 [Rubrivivax sp.]|nr:hypothetical protein [Rubrivivax sp.]MDP3086364.1 hypothetical protein [Rubrivivax sp.]